MTENTPRKTKKEPLKELARCKKEKDEYIDGWKRAKADFANYKKEEQQRFVEFSRISREMLMYELIAVLDSFALGIVMSRGDTIEKKGVELIRNQFADTLKKYGLEKIQIVSGAAFDPGRHEAVSEEESNEPEGTILEEMEAGYMLDGKVLRPARVKISKGIIKQ